MPGGTAGPPTSVVMKAESVLELNNNLDFAVCTHKCGKTHAFASHPSAATDTCHTMTARRTCTQHESYQTQDSASNRLIAAGTPTSG